MVMREGQNKVILKLFGTRIPAIVPPEMESFLTYCALFCMCTANIFRAYIEMLNNEDSSSIFSYLSLEYMQVLEDGKNWELLPTKLEASRTYHCAATLR
jgi:hypothetical protein